MVNEAFLGPHAGIQPGFLYPLEGQTATQQRVSVSRSNVKLYACVHSRGLPADSSLIELVSNFSPLIEETTPDTVVLEVTRTESLFGPPEQLSEKILDHLTRNGADASIAVAANADAAILAARNFPGITILTSGEDYRLSKLPLTALDPVLAGVRLDRADVILETLDLWGLHTLADFAGLPEEGVAETLGPDGIALRQLALGVHTRALNFTNPKIAFEEFLDLEYPIELLEQLSFAISSMLDALCSRLSRYGLAANAIKLDAKLEDNGQYERRLGLPFPMSSAHWISQLLLLEIESSPPGSAIKSLKFSAEPAKPRSMQQGLFEPLAPEPEKLEMTLARLGQLVGRDNVGSPEVLDDHHRDAFRVKSFTLATRRRRLSHAIQKADQTFNCIRLKLQSRCRNGSLWPPVFELGKAWGGTDPSADPGIAPSTTSHRSVQTFRVFRPPLSARVESESGRLTLLKIQEDRILRGGRIVRESGPWKVSGRWWSDADHWDREEWDVALSNGWHYGIFHDPGSDQWYVDGIYD